MRRLDVQTFPNPWLHVGSGPHAVEGWINLDLNSWPEWERQPDVLGSVFDLPFEDETMTKVYMGHVAEHLAWDKVPAALEEIKRVMTPDGVLCLVGPCLEKAVVTRQPDWLLQEIPRGWNAENDPEGFPHLWCATTLLTKIALERVFEAEKVREVPITEVKLPEWANTAESDLVTRAGMWQCAFLANK